MKTRIYSLILSLFLCIFAGNTMITAQEVKAKTSVATENSLTKTATKTNYTFKGLPVYKSSKGSYFVTKKSKKTGNWYKVYVTVS